MVPLKQVEFKIDIRNNIASTAIEQSYLNSTQKPLEVEYIFPILPEICIEEFSVLLPDGRVMTGLIKEKQ